MPTATQKPDASWREPYDPSGLLSALERAGMIKRVVAERVDVAPWTLSRWLSGEWRPRAEYRAKLAEVLGGDERQMFPDFKTDAP
jgi:transcriptional regulator with XRE-family HTH domain